MEPWWNQNQYTELRWSLHATNDTVIDIELHGFKSLPFDENEKKSAPKQEKNWWETSKSHLHQAHGIQREDEKERKKMRLKKGFSPDAIKSNRQFTGSIVCAATPTTKKCWGICNFQIIGNHRTIEFCISLHKMDYWWHSMDTILDNERMFGSFS